jgi:hypothetical protein
MYEEASQTASSSRETLVAAPADVVYVLRRQDPILWEGDGPPRQLCFEDVGSATLP